MRRFISLRSILVFVLIFEIHHVICRNQRAKGFRCILPEKPTFGDLLMENEYKKTGDIIEPSTIVNITCEDGYKPTLPFMFCLSDGNWNVVTPHCEQLCPTFYNTTSIKIYCHDKTGAKIKCNQVTDQGYLTHKCKKYHETRSTSKTIIYCQNGKWSSPKPICEPICGKEDLKNSQHPWTATIYRKIGSDYISHCKGTIISNNLVLSAAQCVTRIFGSKTLEPENIIIAAAQKYKTYNDFRDSKAQYLNVEKIIISTNYNGQNADYNNNIALLVIKEFFKINATVQPACVKGIADIHLTKNSQGKVTVRKFIEKDAPSDELESRNFIYKSGSSCIKNKSSGFENIICAGCNKTVNLWFDDTGSGLLFKNKKNERYYVHGILSLNPLNSGPSTGITFGFTKVADFHEWIEQHMIKYDAEECILPPYPKNGKYEVDGHPNVRPGHSISSSDLLTVECTAGYVPLFRTIECHLAQYNTLKCRVVDSCPLPKLPQGTTYNCKDKEGKAIDCLKAKKGAILEYTCPKGYRPSVTKPRSCSAGYWGYPSPKCISEEECGIGLFDDGSPVSNAQPLIWNGRRLKKIVYPWIAAIYCLDKTEFDNVCGGNIIRNNIVLTAAHCVTDNNGQPYPSKNYKIGVGTLYRIYRHPQDEQAQYLDVHNIVVHPEFEAESKRYFGDLAIIITEQLIQMNNQVQPICIKDVENISLKSNKDVGEVVGWGVTEDEVRSDVLRVLEIPYKNQEQCMKEMPQDFSTKYNITGKICAGFRNKSKGVCRGDSGSGLVFKKDNRYYIHGLLSIVPTERTYICNFQTNALYTKVAYFYDWIMKEMKKYQV